MIVIKLGGTSVSGIDFITQITKRIVSENKKVIVVLSALSQVTNTLELLKDEKESKQQLQFIKKIKLVHATYISELFSKLEDLNVANRLLDRIIFQLQETLSEGNLNLLSAFGEYLSTSFYSLYLRSLDVSMI